jgi:hypothetical protein
LSNIDQNDEDNIKNESIRGLITRIAQRVSTLFGLKTEDVVKELAHYSATDGKVRQWSKFLMGAVKVAGTPSLRVNGVIVDQIFDMSPQQLANFIKSFFATTAEEEVLLN